MARHPLEFQPPTGPTDRHTVVPSPIGEVLLLGTATQLTGLRFAEADGRAPATDLPRDDAALAEARRQLDEYFAGDRTEFDLALAPTGPAFSMQVWRALIDIGFGETASYGEIAHRIGIPGASRAVGTANNHNPIAVVVPCHRVVGADGTLTGFGGGLDRKHALLALEAPTLF